MNTTETLTDKPASPKGGPRTEAGKKRSANNAIKHGLSGRTVVMPGEDMAIYLSQSKEIVDSLHPETAIEYELAQTIADGTWRMKRLRTVEEGMFAWGNFEEAGNFDAENAIIHAAFTAAKAFRTNSQDFVNLSIYESRIQRGIEKAMKQLKELQAERKARREAEMTDAIRMRNYYKMLNLPFDPAADEFVYSAAEIETEYLRRERRENALRAEKFGFNAAQYRRKAA